MIKNFKLAYKLLPYCVSFKSNVIATVIFFLLGFIIEISTSTNIPAGGLFMLMGAIFPAQMIVTLSLSNLVATTEWKRKFQVDMPFMMMLVWNLIGWTVIVINRAIKVQGADAEYTAMSTNGMLGLAVIVIIIDVYMAVSMKLYWIGLAFFVITYAVVYSLITMPTKLLESQWVSFTTAAVIGYVTMILAAVLYYIVSSALYKLPVSKNAQNTILRRAMK